MEFCSFMRVVCFQFRLTHSCLLHQPLGIACLWSLLNGYMSPGVTFCAFSGLQFLFLEICVQVHGFPIHSRNCLCDYIMCRVWFFVGVGWESHVNIFNYLLVEGRKCVAFPEYCSIWHSCPRALFYDAWLFELLSC